MTLQALKKYCRKFVENPNCVYKSCQGDWIVILEKVSNTRTNENRNSIYDKKYAWYRASHLFVTEIINKVTLKKITSIENSYFKGKIKYNIGEYIAADMFDPDINKVSTNGIHYFRTIDGAFYFELDATHKHSGLFVDWNSNGKLRCSRIYYDGVAIRNSIEVNNPHGKFFVKYEYDDTTERVIKLIFNENNMLVYHRIEM